MQATKSIDVNLLDLSVVPIVNAKQNDRSSRFVAFQLAVGSAPFTVPTGVAGMFRYKKPDGTGGFYDTNEAGQPAIVISGSTVTVELVEQVLTVSGTVKAELNLYDAAGSKLTSFTIDIIVQESVLTDATIVSSDYYNVLTAKVAEGVAAANSATASAAAAAQSAADAAATLAGAMAKSVYDPANGGKQVAFADEVLDSATYASSTPGKVLAAASADQANNALNVSGYPPTWWVPTASVTAFAGTIEPSGWLLCDGRAASRSAYATLFAFIGEAYGAGDGVTTFNLPDLRRRVPIGKDAGVAVGAVGGAESVTLTRDNLPPFSPAVVMNGAVGYAARGTFAGGTVQSYGITPIDNVLTQQGANAEPLGTGQPLSNMQPYVVMNYIIKY